jgi:hypothetical protein
MATSTDNPSMETISTEDGADIVLHDERGLPATDRCDRCGSQAFIKAVMTTGELLFCAHHGEVYMDKVRTVAEVIHDHRPFLVDEEARLKSPLVS